jgi:hypothetical protein
MTLILEIVGALVVGFVCGFLVEHNNAKTAQKALEALQAAASAVKKV